MEIAQEDLVVVTAASPRYSVLFGLQIKKTIKNLKKTYLLFADDNGHLMEDVLSCGHFLPSGEEYLF